MNIILLINSILQWSLVAALATLLACWVFEYKFPSKR